MAYGLTKDGLITKTFEVITQELQQELTANLGQLNFDNNSVIGNLVNIFAEREVLIWQLCQSLYDSFSPNFAEGISLDHNCALLGIKRLPSSYSQVTAQVTAENFSTLPALTLAKIKDTSTFFSNPNEVNIDNESCVGINLLITTAEQTDYKITINNEIVSYTKKDNDTIQLIATGLADVINNKISLNLYQATVTDNVINLISKGYKNNFSCILEPNGGVTILTVINNVLYYAQKIGEIPIPSGSLTEFASLANGIISINNLDSGIIGREVESDVDFRIRRKSILNLNGRSTLQSIKGKLLSLPNVLTVTVNENATAEIVNNIPPYSFEPIVHGGDDKTIAEAIWSYKPVGIKSCGNAYYDITDTTNNIQRIHFSKAVQVYIFIEIAITKNADFNNASIDFIKEDIFREYMGLELGETLKYQSLYTMIYKQQGINEAVVKLGKSDDANAETASLSIINISAQSTEVLVVEKKRINIIVS